VRATALHICQKPSRRRPHGEGVPAIPVWRFTTIGALTSSVQPGDFFPQRPSVAPELAIQLLLGAQ
jgi:hypothetical protein